MDLLERYLQAVGRFLPAATREDTIAELRANLLEQMEARAEERGRPIDAVEAAEVLREHGRPEVVAARYLPQRSLIGPAVFPIYELTLRRGVGYVALVYAVVRAFTLMLTMGGGVTAQQIVDAFLGLFATLLYFWAIVTMVFAAIEFAQSRSGVTKKAATWDPAKLPAVKTETEKQKAMAMRVAELVLHCLWMTYVLLLPWHPGLIPGPGVPYLWSIGARFAPVWHTFYLFVVAALTVQLAMKVAALLRGGPGWRAALPFAKQLIDIAAFGLMVRAGTLFVAADAAANTERIAEVNLAMGLGFRIALVCAVLALGIEGWKRLRRPLPGERVAIGSRR